jgi:hypothetical protein
MLGEQQQQQQQQQDGSYPPDQQHSYALITLTVCVSASRVKALLKHSASMQGLAGL